MIIFLKHWWSFFWFIRLDPQKAPILLISQTQHFFDGRLFGREMSSSWHCVPAAFRLTDFISEECLRIPRYRFFQKAFLQKLEGLIIDRLALTYKPKQQHLMTLDFQEGQLLISFCWQVYVLSGRDMFQKRFNNAQETNRLMDLYQSARVNPVCYGLSLSRYSNDRIHPAYVSKSFQYLNRLYHTQPLFREALKKKIDPYRYYSAANEALILQVGHAFDRLHEHHILSHALSRPSPRSPRSAFRL